MRMRQSFAQFEAAFHEETVEHRARGEALRRAAAKRSRTRRHQRVEKHRTLRYIGLVTAVIATAVAVTVVMFQTLSLLVGG